MLTMQLVFAYPEYLSCYEPLMLSQRQEVDIMATNPSEGSALIATATARKATLSDGGTYWPGEAISLAVDGAGQYAIYATAGSLSGATSCDGKLSMHAAILTAPAFGELTLVGMRASTYGPVTYELITLTSAAPAPPGQPPRQPPSPYGPPPPPLPSQPPRPPPLPRPSTPAPVSPALTAVSGAGAGAIAGGAIGGLLAVGMLVVAVLVWRRRRRRGTGEDAGRAAMQGEQALKQVVELRPNMA